MKKTKRLTIKILKEWCAQNGHTFVRYEDGVRKHDIVHLRLWDIPVTFSVACTPRCGSQAGAARALKTAKSRAVRLRQSIVGGSFKPPK